jgi:hypothetical protein
MSRLYAEVRKRITSMYSSTAKRRASDSRPRGVCECVCDHHSCTLPAFRTVVHTERLSLENDRTTERATARPWKGVIFPAASLVFL